MINTALNKPDIIYLLSKQETLDESMRETLKIKKEHWLLNMRKEHHIALNVEVAEFCNNAYQSWKYWKKKPMSHELILEEAIDVIHFVMLDLNKHNVKTEWTADNIVSDIQAAKSLYDRSEVKEVIYKLMSNNNSSLNVLIYVLQILDYYGFTSQNIIHCYNEKNRENFRRLASGY